MQTATSTNGGAGGGPPRIKRTVSAPGIGHHLQRRSWRPAETVQARQMRKALPVVLENEMDDFNVLQVPESPGQPTPASVERTKKAMQATLALLRKSSTPTLPKDANGKEQQLPVPRQRKAIESSKEGGGAGGGSNLAAPKTPSKQLRRRSHKAALTASANANAPANTPSTPSPLKLKTPNIPSSAPSSAPSSITRPHQPPSISIPKRTLSTSTTIVAPSPRMSTQMGPPSSHHTSNSLSTSTTAYAPSPDPEPLRVSRNISANDMVHAYYTILRERDPGHYLLNLNEEEEEIISQSQYAALLKLACQKFKRGDGRDRVALAYAEEMLGPLGSPAGSEYSGGGGW